VVLHDLARAALDIDSARLHVLRAAAQVDAVGAGADDTSLEDARLRGSLGYAADILRDAMTTLVNIGGAGAFAEVNPLQRHWRDLNVASRHAFLATGPSLEVYRRALFDLPNIFTLI